MNTKQYLLLFILIIMMLGIGCGPILKTLCGIRNVNIKNVEQLKSFCRKNELNLKNVYIYRTDSLNGYPDSTQINFHYLDKVLVFNKKLDQIMYNGKLTGNYCSIPNTDFFTGMNSIFLPLDTINTLDNLLNNYHNLESDSLPQINDSANFYIVYYWAFWYKKFSIRSIKAIKSILFNSDSSLKIQCFYLNNDLVNINYPKEIDFKKLKIDVSF